MLDAEAIRASLNDGWARAELRVLGSVSSTSDIAWAWADAGCAEGTAVFAEEQVQGRGRFGRAWLSPRGRGLLMSFVLRPETGDIGPAHITALAAVAVAEAIEAEAGLAAGIRWPNDVVIAGRKVAGILTECRGARVAPCVVGIGINVNTQRGELPAEIRPTATSLAIEAGRPFAREALAGAVLSRVGRHYREALAGRWAGVAEQWARRAALLGQAVRVQTQRGRHEGRLVASDPLLGVELEFPGGERRAFRAEEALRVMPLRGGADSD